MSFEVKADGRKWIRDGEDGMYCYGPDRWARVRLVSCKGEPGRWYVVRGFAGSPKPDSDALVGGKDEAITTAELWVNEGRL